jgi:hypothetical protein
VICSAAVKTCAPVCSTIFCSVTVFAVTVALYGDFVVYFDVSDGVHLSRKEILTVDVLGSRAIDRKAFRFLVVCRGLQRSVGGQD